MSSQLINAFTAAWTGARPGRKSRPVTLRKFPSLRCLGLASLLLRALTAYSAEPITHSPSLEAFGETSPIASEAPPRGDQPLLLPPLFGVQEVSVKYQQFFQDAVDPMLTDQLQHHLDKELNLTVNVDVLKYAYWNNTVHSETDQHQFRKVGLESQVGFHLGSIADVFYEHYSQHFLDYQGAEAFPRQDGVGIRLYFYRGK